MTDRPRLTVQTIRDRQAAKGLRKCGVSLKDANLPVGALALHALEECVDLINYLTDKPEEMGAPVLCVRVLEACAESLAAIADHPKPLPPDVPTVEAVREFGVWWQFGDVVVELDDTPVGLQFYHPGWRDSELVDPADPRWRGPITLRP